MRAIVNVPICPLMTRPSPTSALADEALLGMVVEVLETTSSQYWLVRTHYRYEGYAPAACLLPEEATATLWEGRLRKVVLHKNTCDVLLEPQVQAPPVLTGLPRGALLRCLGVEEKGWQKVALPDGREGYVPSGILDTHYARPMDLPEAALRSRLVDTALLYAGTHYRWGGKSPLGIDCSGLCSMAYLLSGILIYRDAHLREGFPIRPIPLSKAGPGDLLYFPGHMALYLGEGRYLHSTGRAGSDGVDLNSLDPASPLYREDLGRSLLTAGTYF